MFSQRKAELFGHITEQHVNEAAFLWLLRAQAVRQAHQTPETLSRLECRLDNHIKGLLIAPEQAWAFALEAAEFKEPGEIFVLSLLAFTSGDLHKIEMALACAAASIEAQKALASALGWLPGSAVYPWLKPWIERADPFCRYCAILCCSVRRLDPEQYLTHMLGDKSSWDDTALLSRSLRLIGELKRRDLAPLLTHARTHDHPDVAFWANWSALLLGDKSATEGLASYLLEPGPWQESAIHLAFRSLDDADAWYWINQLIRSQQTFQTLVALGALGDPKGINWLLARMEEPAYARVAGESFSLITGIHWAEAASPPQDASLDPDDEEVEDASIAAFEGYDDLPWPDLDTLTQQWQAVRGRFVPGQRYFLGQTLHAASLRQACTRAPQKRRQAAALELALAEPDTVYPNVKQRQHKGVV